jgi:hypothetical protein
VPVGEVAAGGCRHSHVPLPRKLVEPCRPAPAGSRGMRWSLETATSTCEWIREGYGGDKQRGK